MGRLNQVGSIEAEIMMKKVVLQYYYKTLSCEAVSSKDDHCICWHDEGTGPRKDEKHEDEAPVVAWRIKP